MASSASATPIEALITIKVNFDGQTKRCKLPLRDMGASTFEDKLRIAFQIPLIRQLKIERYSDSAGMYVVLDRNNVSVYKQLYRAAKAKSKLKIRITDMTPAPESMPKFKKETPQQPRPVTVTDEPEQSEKPATKTLPLHPRPRVSTESVAKSAATATTTAPKTHQGSSSDAYKAPQTKAAAAPLSTMGTLERLDNALSKLVNERAEVNRQLGTLASYHSNVSQPAGQQAGETSNMPSSMWREYRVCCNNCDATIPDAHYHCNKCDDDDFDLCLTCVDSGVTCYGHDHWLIKRFKRNGIFVTSTTEKIPPKPKVKEMTPSKEMTSSNPVVAVSLAPAAAGPDYIPQTSSPWWHDYNTYKPHFTRTCNCCVREFPEAEFFHCTACEDFDLCQECFGKDAHGHHPKHGFVPAVEGTHVPLSLQAKMNPGRNQIHAAICDGCDKYVRGVRHKCLDCPDWDYCDSCIANAKVIHPGHRFVPIYELINDVWTRSQYARAVHVGICCDGPLCATTSRQSYITGVRYKCAVCPDTDFCANCEASPTNSHNKTHPLIKFKTPVRRVSVSTCGERGNGTPLPIMGDRVAPRSTSSRATETVSRQVSINDAQTVVNVEPQPASPAEGEKKPEIKKEEEQEDEASVTEAEIKDEEEEDEVDEEDEDEAEAREDKVPAVVDLGAVYVRDTVTDGTVLPPNHVFEQTWVLRNTGKVAWPAGCAVKFVGGDYMGHVDPNHPAGISELVSASESTICYDTLEPGKEYPFTVLLRTPSREGKIISYWRLTTKDGIKFGHRLWCDVTVQAPKVKEEVAVASSEKETSAPAPTTASSQMIFPKLDKESATSSMHASTSNSMPSKDASEPEPEDEVEDFDDCQEWDGSDDGFMTDEEYDILDASDEEYLEEQQKKLLKK